MSYVKETSELLVTLQSDLIIPFTFRIKADSEIGTDLVFPIIFLYLYELNYLTFFMWVLLSYTECCKLPFCFSVSLSQMCCSADPSNFLKVVKNLKSSRDNFFEVVEAQVCSPFSPFCPISLSFTTLCPLFSPFLFDCQVVNSAWRVSGMYRIHPSCHGRGSVEVGRQPAPDPLAASSRQLWGQKGWKLCTPELQHLPLQNFGPWCT